MATGTQIGHTNVVVEFGGAYDPDTPLRHNKVCLGSMIGGSNSKECVELLEATTNLLRDVKLIGDSQRSKTYLTVGSSNHENIYSTVSVTTNIDPTAPAPSSFQIYSPFYDRWFSAPVVVVSNTTNLRFRFNLDEPGPSTVAQVQYALSTSKSASVLDTANWTDIGRPHLVDAWNNTVDSNRWIDVEVGQLALIPGQSYYIFTRTTSSFDMPTVFRATSRILVDATPPVAITTTCHNGFTIFRPWNGSYVPVQDKPQPAFTAIPQVIGAAWEFQDDESVVRDYWYYIERDGQPFIPETHVTETTSVRFPKHDFGTTLGYPLPHRTTYQAFVTACNLAGLCTKYQSRKLTVDVTPPFVTDLIRLPPSTLSGLPASDTNEGYSEPPRMTEDEMLLLHHKWSGSVPTEFNIHFAAWDPDSGIERVYVGIGTSRNATDVMEWTLSENYNHRTVAVKPPRPLQANTVCTRGQRVLPKPLLCVPNVRSCRRLDQRARHQRCWYPGCDVCCFLLRHRPVSAGVRRVPHQGWITGAGRGFRL